MEKFTDLLSATIQHTAPGIVTVRFRADMKLNNAVLAEVMGNRCNTRPKTQAVIVVIPQHTDYDAQIMMVDHYALHGLGGRTIALAIVCEERGLLPLFRLYFAYYPPTFEVRFCDNHVEARSWLKIRAVTNSAA